MLCRGKTQTTACQSGNSGNAFTSRYDVEWLEPDIIDAEVSRLVNGAISVKNPRRWRSSTSSGYSSHSSPLSAGSYSTCCASVLRGAATGTIGDVGLAVIHEADIPRPIWPCGDPDNDVINCHTCDDLCAYCGYARIYSYPGKSEDKCRDCLIPNKSANDVLIELSRKLNSVIDGEINMTAEEILRDITQTVTKGIKVDNADENSCKYPSTSCTAKESVNPVNLRLYEKTGEFNPILSKSMQSNYGNKHFPAVFLVSQTRDICARTCSHIVNCGGKSGDDGRGKEEFGENKRKRGGSRVEAATVKGCYASEPVYSTLDPSDESSSYGAVGEPPSKTTWNQGITVFNKNLDFTLDGARAERLGRIIVRAKRRRQWCRALTAIFGLVFFILSVIVVSMSITKGRKIFGSM